MAEKNISMVTFNFWKIMSLLCYDGTNTNSVIWTFLLLALDLESGVIYPDILSLFSLFQKISR